MNNTTQTQSTVLPATDRRLMFALVTAFVVTLAVTVVTSIMDRHVNAMMVVLCTGLATGVGVQLKKSSVG